MRGRLHVVDGRGEPRLHVIQVAFAAVLALFPTLLFFQFDHERVGTMRGKWVRAVFRMDHRMETLADINTRYGDELAEASTCSAVRVRFLGGRHSPIIVATILISLGWTLLVIRTESFDFAARRSNGARPDGRCRRAASQRRGGVRRQRRQRTRRCRRRRQRGGEPGCAGRSAAVQFAAQSADLGVAPVATTAGSPSDQSIAAQDATRSAETAAGRQSRAVQQPFFQLLLHAQRRQDGFPGAYFFGVYLILRCSPRRSPAEDLQPDHRTARHHHHARLPPQRHLRQRHRQRPVPVDVIIPGRRRADRGLQQMGRITTGSRVSSTRDSGGSVAPFAQVTRRATSASPRSTASTCRSRPAESEGIADVTSLAEADLVP